MNKIEFDPNDEDGLELARAIVINRLRSDSNWKQFEITGQGYERYVKYIGDTHEGMKKLAILTNEVLWEFTFQRIISPGTHGGTPHLPFFHITDYGKKVLDEEEFQPHDPTSYLERFRRDIPDCDPTVESYLAESLNCFITSNLIASVVMLGVASERIFLLLCISLHDAIADSNEQSHFGKVLKRNAIKPKMDAVLDKINIIQSQAPRPLPDNVNVMLIVIFDFIRIQRNDLGHPQEKPPKTSREEALVNLRIFPTYYKMVKKVIDYLDLNKV